MSRGTHARAIVVGRMGQDVEVKTIGQGKKVANLSLAVTRGYGDRQATSWFRVQVFGDKTIQVLEDYTQKGSRLLVDGELAIREYQTNNGGKGYATEITVGFDGVVEILDGIQNDEDRHQRQAQDNQFRQTHGFDRRPEAQGQDHGNGYGRRPMPILQDDLDDDIPF